MLFTGKKKIITVRFLNVLECYELMMRGGGSYICSENTGIVDLYKKIRK